MESPPQKILEAEALFEGRNDKDVQATGKGELNAMEWAKNDNQLSNELALFIKATKKLMDCHALRAMTESWRRPMAGGDDEETEWRCRGMKCGRERDAIFF